MTGLDIVTYVFTFLGIVAMWVGGLLQMNEDGSTRDDARLLIGMGFGMVLTALLMLSTSMVLTQFIGYDLNACISYQVLVHPPKID